MSTLPLRSAPARAVVLGGFRGPGLGWVPAVWRRAATWKTVLRFVLLGPLIGGAPYALLLFTIPFAYLVGTLPALIAGALFATWYHGPGRTPGWAWRAAIGALCGGAAAVLAGGGLAFGAEFGAGAREWFFVGLMAVHGIPAAVVLALLQKPPAAAGPQR